MFSLPAYLPQQPGFLPKWVLLISTVSILASAQAYITTAYVKRTYPYIPKPRAAADGSAPMPMQQVTPLSSRTFGTYTFIAGIVRFYGAYHLDEPDWYKLVMWTYAVALAHFGSEALVYGTTGLRTGAFSTYLISIGTLGWMWNVWGEYVK